MNHELDMNEKVGAYLKIQPQAFDWPIPKNSRRLCTGKTHQLS
jgi:hypothetical protein